MPRLRVLYYRTLPLTEKAEVEAHELELPQGEGNGGGLMQLATLQAGITSLTVRGCRDSLVVVRINVLPLPVDRSTEIWERYGPSIGPL